MVWVLCDRLGVVWIGGVACVLCVMVWVMCLTSRVVWVLCDRLGVVWFGCCVYWVCGLGVV